MSEWGAGRGARVLGALAVLGIAVVAFLAGMLTERVRYDARRGEVLRRYDQALRQHQQQIMNSEKGER
jgi:hypothetical protein